MSEVLSGKVYVHYKGGKYVVLNVCEESTNARVGTRGVIYVSLTYGRIKHRDLAEFVEEIQWPDGITRPRFILEGKLNEK